MKEYNLEIDKELSGHRIESVLKNRLEFSSGIIKKIKRTEGAVCLNGKSAKVVEKVTEGDKLKVILPMEKSGNVTPAEIPISVLYEDEDVMVVCKSRGIPTHPVRGHLKDTLANGIVNYFGEGTVCHIITRLDKDTSGAVLIAKNPVAASILASDMKKRLIHKEYFAVVNGSPDPPVGIITAAIKKEAERCIRRCVSPDGKEAVTEYETIKTENALSLVRLVPVTGRTHQLRVHMSYIGNPIYGDSMYGACHNEGKTRLHCSKITFMHPVEKVYISVEAPFPADMSFYNLY